MAISKDWIEVLIGSRPLDIGAGGGRDGLMKFDIETAIGRFFDAIDRTPIGAFVARKREIVENTDPNRISVENVRSFFSIPRWLAAFLCEMAVREGAFAKHKAVHCPTCGRIQLLTIEEETDGNTQT